MSNEKKATNTLDAMLAQYEENKSSSTGTKEKKEYDLKNYFNTYIKEGLETGTKTVRILPTADGSSPFVVMSAHKIVVEGELKTFACLKDARQTACPFCEAREALLATGTEANKELAKKYGSRKMYIVKVIDRENEAEGVKFWRFPHNYKQQGIYDKIFGILKAIKKDITDAETGRDCLITINRDKNGALTVSQVATLDPSKLSEDPVLAKAWTSDKRTWEDVYSVKTYDYLEIIVRGGSPRWDKEAKKFVDKASLKTGGDKLEQELTMGVENVKANVKAATKTEAPVAAAAQSDGSDDLPF